MFPRPLPAWRRARRILLLSALACVAAAATSYLPAIAEKHNVGLGVNHNRTRLEYTPGTAEPPEPLGHRGSGEVPPQLRDRLVATFNGGFPLETSNAGLIYRGKLVETMVNGIATIVGYRDGGLDIVPGLGIDARGNLLYAAANYQTVQSLAKVLKATGAVRALELDINEDWTSFITYRHPGAREASNLLPEMFRSPERYLEPDERDFFAVYLRAGQRW
jgi:hypothetical protein